LLFFLAKQLLIVVASLEKRFVFGLPFGSNFCSFFFALFGSNFFSLFFPRGEQKLQKKKKREKKKELKWTGNFTKKKIRKYQKREGSLNIPFY